MGIRITPKGAKAIIRALCSWTSEPDASDSEQVLSEALKDVFDKRIYPEKLWEELAQRLTEYISSGWARTR